MAAGGSYLTNRPWRADVLASDPGGAWRMALEAQLAPITAEDITARTERMRADGVTAVWFSDRPKPPWLGVVPSVRLARPDDGEGLVIAEGLMKFDGWWQDVPAGLAQFLSWASAGRVVPYRPRVYVRDGMETIWTALRYIQAFDEHCAELERRASHHRGRQDPQPHQSSTAPYPLTRISSSARFGFDAVTQMTRI